MKKLLALSFLAVNCYAQSSATLQFAGETVGAVLTVNTNGFTPEIQGLENLIVSTGNNILLTVGVTAGSTTYTLSNATGVLPGMGLAFGCSVGGGNCSVVAVVKAAGCTANVCQVVQGTLGTTGNLGVFAIGTPVTVIQYGNGSMLTCSLLDKYRYLAQAGAATASTPNNSSLASTAMATQNAAIAAAAAANAAIIAAAFTCVPSI